MLTDVKTWLLKNYKKKVVVIIKITCLNLNYGYFHTCIIKTTALC